jgi:hypothetical protein
MGACGLARRRWDRPWEGRVARMSQRVRAKARPDDKLRDMRGALTPGIASLTRATGAEKGDATQRSRGTMCPGPCIDSCPSENSEGAGNAGRRCTRALVCKKGRRTHTSWSQVQPNTSGIPRAMLDDLFRALLGVPGVLVTVAHNQLASLTPASGCRDHTASSDASRALRPCALIASIASPPHVS